MNWYLFSVFNESKHPQTQIYQMQAHSAADVEFIVNFNLKKSIPQLSKLYGIAPMPDGYKGVYEDFKVTL